ncbi:hypothetical protein ACWGCW_36975 [Streptomyces sp. NPDC054933]
MRKHHAALPTVIALCGAVVLGAAGSAAAHGDTIDFRISGQDAGHIRTVASWDNDGDPVTETLSATLSAVSADGQRTAGPWPLVAVPGSTATFTTREALSAGQWKISVESGFPALGRGEATMTVADGTAPKAAIATRSSSGPTVWLWSAAAAATLFAVCAAAFLVSRKRDAR